MTSYKHVAIIGGSGNLGQAVLKALLNSDFNVTVLTRKESNAIFPESVKVQRVDYESDTSLVEAFHGKDAVISVIATSALNVQTRIIQAAYKAGVKRFVPSEFGLNVVKLEDGGLKTILGAKVQSRELLEKLATEDQNFTWTGISTNLFFDWGLQRGAFGFDIANRAAIIYDSGNEKFTTTTLSTIGAAVVSVLKHADETANKYIDIASFRTTQNELLSIIEDEMKVKWTLVHKRTDDVKQIADGKLAQRDYSAFGDYLKIHFFKDGEGKSVSDDELANGLLDLPKEDLRHTIERILA